MLKFHNKLIKIISNLKREGRHLNNNPPVIITVDKYVELAAMSATAQDGKGSQHTYIQ